MKNTSALRTDAPIFDPLEPADVSERTEPSGRAAFVRALHVRRNAKWGFAISLVVTLAVFGFFVVVPGTTRPPALYVALGFVLAVSLGGLMTAVLTLFSAIRLAKET